MSLQIEMLDETEPSRVGAALRGRLDGGSASEFDRQMLPWLDSPRVQTLVLELSGLDYISSAGLRSIFRARKQLALRDARLLLLNPQPQVQRVFDIVKAVPLSEIFNSVEELDAYLERIQAPDSDS
jgi:anti-anti-sigma factor